MIHVAVLGYGTVGSGVVEVIETNKEAIDKRAAAKLNIKYILDLRDFPGDPYEDKVVHDFNICLRARVCAPPIKSWWQTTGRS